MPYHDPQAPSLDRSNVDGIAIDVSVVCVVVREYIFHLRFSDGARAHTLACMKRVHGMHRHLTEYGPCMQRTTVSRICKTLETRKSGAIGVGSAGGDTQARKFEQHGGYALAGVDPEG